MILLQQRVGKRVTVRIPSRLKPVPFPPKRETAQGKLIALSVAHGSAGRATIDFGKLGKHDVRTADVLP